MTSEQAIVIGGGLAGSEAAWQLANAGIQVSLYEQKPLSYSAAHHMENLAELVCSNSLKASRLETAAGLLKEEMRRLGSLLVPCAEETSVPAGGALAVDREKFSSRVTEKIYAHPNITVVREIVETIPPAPVIVATGPLTDGKFAAAIETLTGKRLSFYDAAAPIVTAESLDRTRIFAAARYDRGKPDYLNCPMTQAEYDAFYSALVTAERAELHDCDKETFRVYEGCMPIEVLASRGQDTMRYGPLKPVGLRDPRTGTRPYAVVQLRREDVAGTRYNLVGFQTNLRFPEQKRVFSKIPGLEKAEYVRYGVMHRNSFLDSPRLLEPDFSLRGADGIYFAGQMTGVEGYMESAASGILAGKNLARYLQGKEPLVLPLETMTGALAHYICSGGAADFQPMGANMGLLPPIQTHLKKQEKYHLLSERALEALALKEEQES